MKYRVEIDGLRAISVLSVIFFHAGFTVFSGGYLGVDIFFVISGYLITSIIVNDIEKSVFSLSYFYERRIRRILPVLFIVMFVSMPLAWLSLTPDELKNYSQSIVAVISFSSNILFWLESGYFDHAADLKPLLHTWSLAVEEQYYIFFPILMIALWRSFRRHLVLTLLILFFSSLAFAHYYSTKYLSASFYLLPFRAWELLLGSFSALALRRSDRIILPGIYNQLLSLIGLTFIVFSMVIFDGRTPTPSLYTLLPTLGAVLIILFTTQETLTYKLLSFKPIAFIGLLSYSAYLWHQPIFSFVRNFSLSYPSLKVMTGLSLFILFLSYFSWKYIETPFRRREKVTTKTLAAFCSTFAAFFIVVGLMGHTYIKDVDSIEVGGDVVTLPNIAFRGINYERQNCSFPKLPEEMPCRIPGNAVDTNVTLFLLGDSLVRVLSEAVYERTQIYSNLVDLSASGCPFLLGLSIYNGRSSSEECTPDYQQNRLEYIANSAADKKVVIVSGNWLVGFMDDSFDNTRGGVSPDQNIVATGNINASQKEIEIQFFDSFRRSISALSQISDHIILVTPGYDNGWDPVRRALRIHKQLNNADELFSNLEIPLNAIIQRTSKLDAFTQKIENEFPNVSIIDSRRFTCDKEREVCYGGQNGNFYFTDGIHLSLYTNRMITDSIQQILETL